MGNPLAVSTNSYHGYPLDDALRGIAAAGFQYVELSSVPGWTEHVSLDTGRDRFQKLRALLARHHLLAISLSAHSDLTSAEGADRLRRSFDLAEAVGATIINTGTGTGARTALIENLRVLGQEAAPRGLSICVETHGELLPTGEVGAAVMREVGLPNVRINYDTANVIYYADIKPEDDLRPALPYLGHMHIKDQVGGQGQWNFPAIGAGQVNFPAIFALLKEHGYTGTLSVELEFFGEPWPPLGDVDQAIATSYRYLEPYAR